MVFWLQLNKMALLKGKQCGTFYLSYCSIILKKENFPAKEEIRLGWMCGARKLKSTALCPS